METRKEDKKLNITTSVETPRGSISVFWVIEDDGLAVGHDEEENRWEAFWTGSDIIEPRKS